jgi:carbonic anhydrase/acetyltransferase-like protein (isoleucine patch superfamily)
MNIRPFATHYPSIASDVYLDPTAVIIGQVTIATQCSIWPMAVLRGDINSISLGSKTNVQDGAILHVTHASSYNPAGFPLIIGDEVTVGHQAVLHGCTVGSRCLIGIGAKVLDGAVIEDEVLLGAGSLVPPGKTLHSGYLWLGSPAKPVRPLTQQEREFFSYSATHYAKLRQAYQSASC